MTNEMADNYIENVLKPKLEWYDSRATTIKRRYFIIGAMQIILLALIPPVNAYARMYPNLIFISSLLAAIGSISGSFIIFSNLKENWTRYRQTHNQLSSELIKFENKLEPYNHKNCEKSFVAKCENIMSYENDNWHDQVK